MPLISSGPRNVSRRAAAEPIVERGEERDNLSYILNTCPATRTVQIIGGRWKLIILYHLSFGTKRYSDLQRGLPGITPKMLTQQLRELEEDGVVHREVYRQVPPKVEYSLTDLGESLRPVVTAMTEWGKANAADAFVSSAEAAEPKSEAPSPKLNAASA